MLKRYDIMPTMNSGGASWWAKGHPSGEHTNAAEAEAEIQRLNGHLRDSNHDCYEIQTTSDQEISRLTAEREDARGRVKEQEDILELCWCTSCNGIGCPTCNGVGRPDLFTLQSKLAAVGGLADAIIELNRLIDHEDFSPLWVVEKLREIVSPSFKCPVCNDLRMLAGSNENRLAAAKDWLRKNETGEPPLEHLAIILSPSFQCPGCVELESKLAAFKKAFSDNDFWTTIDFRKDIKDILSGDYTCPGCAELRRENDLQATAMGDMATRCADNDRRLEQAREAVRDNACNECCKELYPILVTAPSPTAGSEPGRLIYGGSGGWVHCRDCRDVFRTDHCTACRKCLSENIESVKVYAATEGPAGGTVKTEPWVIDGRSDPALIDRYTKERLDGYLDDERKKEDSCADCGGGIYTTKSGARPTFCDDCREKHAATDSKEDGA